MRKRSGFALGAGNVFSDHTSHNGLPPGSVSRSLYVVFGVSDCTSNRQNRPCRSVLKPSIDLAETVRRGVNVNGFLNDALIRKRSWLAVGIKCARSPANHWSTCVARPSDE